MSEREIIERTVLGCLTAFCDSLKQYIQQIDQSDFELCPQAYALLRSCFDSDSVSMATILAKFAGAGKLDFIKSCISSVAVVHEFAPALKRLRELNLQSRLEKGVTDLLVAKSMDIHSLRKVIEDAEAHSGVQSDERACEKNLDDYLAQLGLPQETISTGFATVDKTTSGLRRQSVCYIGARPSTGKTAFAINIAQAQANKRVLFFSLEMSAAMIYDRFAASSMFIEYEKFTSNKLTADEIALVRDFLNLVRDEKRFYIIDNIYGIEAIVNCVMNIRPDVVIIDYIQKVTTTKKMAQARECIEYISSELKKLAKFADCAVICLSQLSRNGTEFPRMSDLKESGALEADGDYIFLLHRPFVLSKDEDVDPAECDLLVDKNKFGNTGLIKMHFDGEHQRFFEKKEIEKAKKIK